MRKVELSNVFLIVGVLLFCACAPTYIPNARHVPLISEQGQLNLGAAVLPGLEVQSAYGISDQLAVMGNASFRSTSSTTNENYSRQNYGELAVGYFNNLETNLLFEVYGGYGFGASSSRYDSNSSLGVSYNDSGNYGKVFIQPNIGFSSQFLDLALSGRMAYVAFNNFETNRTLDNYSTSAVFFEPALVTKLGYDPFKFVAMLGMNIPLDQPNSRFAPNFPLFTVSLGMQFRINTSR